MNLALVLKETKRDTMYRRITPSFIEETTSSVKMVEIVLICLATPEAHIRNLEVTPEVAGRITVRLVPVDGPALSLGQPRFGSVLVQVFGMLSDEFARLRPEGRNRRRCIVESDREAIGLVVVLHVAEHVVVDIAEEMNLGLDTPVVLHVF